MENLEQIVSDEHRKITAKDVDVLIDAKIKIASDLLNGKIEKLQNELRFISEQIRH